MDMPVFVKHSVLVGVVARPGLDQRPGEGRFTGMAGPWKNDSSIIPCDNAGVNEYVILSMLGNAKVYLLLKDSKCGVQRLLSRLKHRSISHGEQVALRRVSRKREAVLCFDVGQQLGVDRQLGRNGVSIF